MTTDEFVLWAHQWEGREDALQAATIELARKLSFDLGNSLISVSCARTLTEIEDHFAALNYFKKISPERRDQEWRKRQPSSADNNGNR